MNNKLYFLAMLVVSVLLCLFRITGTPVHIVISLIGLLLTILVTVKGRQNWTKPALEILMRVMFLLALISGAVIMRIDTLVVAGILHRVFAAVFVVLLLVNYAGKAFRKN